MLPFFVYGTLLPAQPNHDLIADAVELMVSATLHDATLYDIGGMPMLATSAESSVVGALLYIHAAQYAACLAKLDHLEQYIPDRPAQSLYLRERRVVETVDGQGVEAWVYVGRSAYLTGLAPIGGDWVDYSAESRRIITKWTNLQNDPFGDKR